MYKLYKNICDYADQNNMCRQTASIKIKSWEIELVKLPKCFKYLEIDKTNKNLKES